MKLIFLFTARATKTEKGRRKTKEPEETKKSKKSKKNKRDKKKTKLSETQRKRSGAPGFAVSSGLSWASPLKGLMRNATTFCAEFR